MYLCIYIDSMYDVCLFTYSDRLTFWSKHNPKKVLSVGLLRFCENQHLEPKIGKWGGVLSV